MLVVVPFPVIRTGGEDDHDAERLRVLLVHGRDERIDDVGRPQVLVFKVDQALRLPQGTGVGMVNAELAARGERVHAPGNRAHDLHRRLP